MPDWTRLSESISNCSGPEIEGAYDDRIRMHSFRQYSIDAVLFFFAGKLAARLRQNPFRSKQPHAFRTVMNGRFTLFRKVDVCLKRDAIAVQGLSRQFSKTGKLSFQRLTLASFASGTP